MQQQNRNNQPVKPVLPLSGRIAIYARVAPGAKRAASPQTDDLLTLARERGYSNEQIIVYEDRGVSGRTTLFERGAFNDLITKLDRLFRDATVTQVSIFIEICRTYGIQLITPSMTFDFTKADDVATFRFQCERATLYIMQAMQRKR